MCTASPCCSQDAAFDTVETISVNLSNEPNFDTCRASADNLLNDPSLPETHKMQKSLDSLLPPASDINKHVNPNSPASEFLRLLQSFYGLLADGDKLLA